MGYKTQYAPEFVGRCETCPDIQDARNRIAELEAALHPLEARLTLADAQHIHDECITGDDCAGDCAAYDNPLGSKDGLL